MITLEQLTGAKETKSNNRVGSTGKRGQSYTGLRFSRNSKSAETFNFSDDKWSQLGLDSRGFFISPIDGKVYLVLVDDTAEGKLQPTILKNSGKSEKGTKTNKFKNDVLRDRLVEAGLLTINEADVVDGKPAKSYFELEKVDVPDAAGVYGVFVVVPSEANAEIEDEDDSEEEEESPEEDSSEDSAEEDQSESVDEDADAPSDNSEDDEIDLSNL